MRPTTYGDPSWPDGVELGAPPSKKGGGTCGPVPGAPAPSYSHGSGYGRASQQPAAPEEDHGGGWGAQSSWNVPEEECYGNKLPQGLTGEIRAAFVRKVYGILCAQMLVTVVMCGLGMYVPPCQAVLVHFMKMPWGTLGIFIPAMCVMCCLQAKKAEHPTNYYLLLAFTILMGTGVAGICALYQAAGLGVLILEAAALTAAVFGGLSLYALWSGKDFSWMGGILFMGLMGMMLFSVIGWLFGFSGGAAYSLFGVVLFSGFVLYDTSRILHIYGPDDALIAAVELYLDVINLFLYILELLSRCQEQNS